MKKNVKLTVGILLAVLATGCLVAGGILLRYSLAGRDKSGAVAGSNATDSDENNMTSGDSEAVDSDISGKDENAEDSSSQDSGLSDAATGETETVEVEPEEIFEPERVENPYKDYYIQNEDMAAWLYIPDTVIDYPVMYTPFDENYYLNRDFNKSGNANGCLILDTDSSMEPLSTNLIIHGHNMGSGAMFGTLTKYENEEYCNNHKYIYLYGKDYEHIYEVVAVFRSKVFYKTEEAFKYYKFFNAETQEEFDDFYDNIKSMSVFDTGVTAEFGDHFITLSTCAYHVQNGRFVVVAKEIEPGEYYFAVDFESE